MAVRRLLHRIASAVRRTVRIAKTVVRDPRIPRPVRWLLVIGLLPIPGPLDEVVALIALGLIALFWRPILRDARDRA